MLNLPGQTTFWDMFEFTPQQQAEFLGGWLLATVPAADQLEITCGPEYAIITEKSLRKHLRLSASRPVAMGAWIHGVRSRVPETITGHLAASGGKLYVAPPADMVDAAVSSQRHLGLPRNAVAWELRADDLPEPNARIGSVEIFCHPRSRWVFSEDPAIEYR